jgi:uncharacterized protein
LDCIHFRVKRPFLTARWQHLLFLNFRIERALAQSLVPSGTELDLLDGDALVSVVAFRFLDTRILGAVVPFHRDFDEINLRMYVRRRVGRTWRRGVVFVRELVPRPAIAWTARLAYNEPYRAVRMRHAIAMDDRAGGSLCYEWKDGPDWHSVSATVAGSPLSIDPDSPTGFITEHYFGYTAQRDGGTIEYEVRHERWSVWRAETAGFRCDVGRVYGPEWIDPLGAEPLSSFVCDGAPVAISFPVRLP